MENLHNGSTLFRKKRFLVNWKIFGVYGPTPFMGPGGPILGYILVVIIWFLILPIFFSDLHFLVPPFCYLNKIWRSNNYFWLKKCFERFMFWCRIQTLGLLLYFDEMQNVRWILDLIILSGGCVLMLISKFTFIFLCFIKVKQRCHCRM